MPHIRRSRFRREIPDSPIAITPRDREIIHVVHRYRFLTSAQIVKLVSGSPQQILRRLQLLYHHGFLERPRAQLDYYYRGGSRAIVYGLGNKGAILLREEDVDVITRSGEKNRAVGRVQLEHVLFVSEILISIAESARKHGVQFLDQPEIETGQPFHWQVKLNAQTTLGVIPDRTFALEHNADRVNFFLEADRGTMPVVRTDLAQTSLYRKLLTYEATWAQSIHSSRFGFNRFRLLVVTKSPERVESLLDACSRLKRGHGLFLFADAGILKSDVLSALWRTGKGGAEPMF